MHRRPLAPLLTPRLPPVHALLATLLLLTASTATAQNQSAQDQTPLARLVSAVDGHPALAAARASLVAAQRRLQGVSDPISLSASYGYSGFLYEEPDPTLPPIELADGQQQISVDATLRPFLFGDLLDLADQRQVEVLRAALALREARANLESQAVEAATTLFLAQAGVELARSGVDLAADALSASGVRFERGAATAGELERARLSLAQAESRLRGAENDLHLAELSLELLVGPARLSDIPELEPVSGVPPDVERSRLDLTLAEIGLRNAERGLIPTVQASYAWNLDVDNSLSISLESRTLQPTLGFQHSSLGGVGPTPSPGPALDATFSIGVGLTIGPELFRNLDATRDQRSAAEARLRADVERLPITELTLQNGLAAAERQLALAGRERDLAEADLSDVRARVDLGLATDLEAAQAGFSLSQAELALLSARLERLSRILDWYTSYAIPLSEVLP